MMSGDTVDLEVQGGSVSDEDLREVTEIHTPESTKAGSWGLEK